VRQGGDGGLLNVLDLEFAESSLPAIAHDPPPVAEVQPSRPRSSFRKVLAKVGTDIKTYCSGYATVLVTFMLGCSFVAEEALMAASKETAPRNPPNLERTR